MKIRKYKSQKGDDLSSKLKSYTALAGAFILTAGNASGQIIYTDLDPDTIIHKSVFDIDLDHDGVKDFSIGHSTTYGIDKVVELHPGVNPGNRGMAAFKKFNLISNYYIQNLPAGNPIGPGGPFYTFGIFNALRVERQWIQFTSTWSRIFRCGYWQDTIGYIGVEFNTNGNTFYGWIEVAVDSAVDSIRIMGYAYESTPGGYIIAGAGNRTGISENEFAISPANSFYPNPVTNGKTFIQIDAKKPSELKFEIINGIGQVLQSEERKLNPGKSIVDIDVSSLANGTYFVKILVGEKVYFRKILVVKD